MRNTDITLCSAPPTAMRRAYSFSAHRRDFAILCLYNGTEIRSMHAVGPGHETRL